ncbi:IS4 family transposase [Gloeocapsopsis sp. IPPAS B-1203]|uniref:IS4 family transposase n=1 Tax=Gloeocapsopsis sp. IPPAS B-1203 TaxID=2049454 RepID=UPI000C186D3E|nr:IS4 family transposase [Gloeocapsopsis sp. IPPAS B-1203]PIG90418.1 IS4 family transposase [Gloeocapsopsis sp. IPPAS B-1203]
MLPKFYQTHLRSTLNANQYILLNLLVELLQGQKQVRLERLAANLPLPIKFESRRRLLQRFLMCQCLTISTIWFAIINYLLCSYFTDNKELILVVDRTQWRDLNLLMVSLVWNSRAIPVNWQFLSHRGNSNFNQQQALFTTVLPQLDYKVTVLGDREFCSIELGQWLEKQGVAICLRLRCNEYIRRQNEFTQQLKQLGLKPGLSMFFAGVNITKQNGFSQFNVACKWSRNYRRTQTKEGWFLLTNLSTLQAAVATYQQRSGIECMFKDCKSGGYNLEGCYAIEARLSVIVLLIAIAYTSAIIQGISIKTSKVERYICRPKDRGRIQRRHSNFWIGLYGKSWLNNLQLCIHWVGQWMRINRNKQLYYQRGLKAIDQIQPLF